MKNERKSLDAIILPDGRFVLEWEERDELVDKSTIIIQNEIESRYRESPELCALSLGFLPASVELSPSLSFLRAVSAFFARALVRSPEIESVRGAFRAAPNTDEANAFVADAPFVTGSEYVDAGWIASFVAGIGDEFGKRIRDHEGSVASFVARYSRDLHIFGRVFFHLVENRNGEKPFAFLATHTERPEKGKSSGPVHLPLSAALERYGRDGEGLLDLLVTVRRAAARSAFVAEILESGEIFSPLGLGADEAYAVLREIPLYEECGILCRIPDWWKNRSSAIRVNVSVGTKTPSRLGLDAILDFSAVLSIGGETIDADEARKLLAQNDGLALIKGRWVEVDHARLSATLDAYERASRLIDDGIGFAEAMRLQLGGNEAVGLLGKNTTVDVEVSNGDWLARALSNISRPNELPTVSVGDDFRAYLRPYQTTGVGWLHAVSSLGFGACLADDMGLGKTVQVIALLNGRRNTGGASLLVVPASLIANWTAELDRFAPSIRYRVLHPSGKKNVDGLIDPDACDLVVTTYGMLPRTDWLAERRWPHLVIDEAQAIRNPGTKQTKAVKHIRAERKIALTGTPIENRLSDLWSLFDFLNPGLLGSAAEFTRFTKRLADDPGRYGRLKRIVSPFILRRLKTDRSIIDDLPEKIEMKAHTALTRTQAVHYEAFVAEVEEKLATAASKIARSGLILASLLKLKQICNHPDQYLGRDSYDPDESGKFARVAEVCATIREKHERVLVFTQFREITRPLDCFLRGVFGRPGLVLHGNVPVAKRKEIVETFQSDEYVPYMVLSIKAGGVGLNLTRANHVVHFDRWWNPAVENQATDRAFRIGQKRNVVVHKFVTDGTIEEKIDALIEDKKSLAGEIVPDSGETWITEMDNASLMKLFRLNA
jgi:hypothetical protein